MGLALIAAFIVFPVVELIVLIKVGGAIGILPLLLLLVVTGIAGAALVRLQGMAVARRTFEQLARHEAPVDSMIDGIGLTLAGFLLLLPGLVSDVMALFLLVPVIRRAAVRRMLGFTRVRGGWPRPGPARWSGSSAGPRPGGDHDGAESGGSERGAPPPRHGDGIVIDGEFERLEERTVRPDRGRPGSAGSGSVDEAGGPSPWRR